MNRVTTISSRTISIYDEPTVMFALMTVKIFARADLSICQRREPPAEFIRRSKICIDSIDFFMEKN